jgi:antitoxin component of RelBE/YafQ-DinJ toxin-antitoxin module
MARASTLNAHYTSPVVIKAIYDAVENMGFTTGNILEIIMQRLIQFNDCRRSLQLVG